MPLDRKQRRRNELDRRQFLKQSVLRAGIVGAAIGAFPAIVPASALGKGGRPAPSNRVVMGAVGYGWMGEANVKSFLNRDDVQIVAMCDIDREYLDKARDAINGKYGNKDCAGYNDFREMFARGDLDAATIAVPDHWHAALAIPALRAGLDVYGEKPLTHSLREGRALVDAVSQNGRIWQTGSWQRSVSNFHRAAELVRNGRIGKVHTVEVGLGGGPYTDFTGDGERRAPEPIPDGFDYEMWVGPAPYSPYCPARVRKNWRWMMDTGGGMLTDWIGHHGDIGHWGLGFDHTGPAEVEGKAIWMTDFWNVPENFDCWCTYANGVRMHVATDLRGGTKWIGDKGWVWVTRGALDAEPKSVLDEVIGPEETRLYKSTDHWANFIDCVRTRKETITPAETAHRSVSIAHLCMVAMKTGRKIKWDPKTETIIGDADANRLLSSPMRAPWQV